MARNVVGTIREVKDLIGHAVIMVPVVIVALVVNITIVDEKSLLRNCLTSINTTIDQLKV
jgi:hypothetical protein